jgi:uncharacterized membrane protein YkvA (DUF1232 family)
MSWLSTPRLLLLLASHVRLAMRLLREPRVPLIVKGLPLLAAIYVVFPLDVVPDLLPVLGQVDDLGVALAALELFIRLCPPAAVAFHRAAMVERRPYSAMAPSDDFIDVG